MSDNFDQFSGACRQEAGSLQRPPRNTGTLSVVGEPQSWPDGQKISQRMSSVGLGSRRMNDLEIEAGTAEFYKAIAAAARAEGPLVYYDGAYGGRLKPHRLLYERLLEKTGTEVIQWYTCGQE